MSRWDGVICLIIEGQIYHGQTTPVVPLLHSVYKTIASLYRVGRGQFRGQLAESFVLASCRGEECGHEELVRCARPLERISNSDLSFVTKKEDINKLCPDLEAGMKCIKKYTLNCMQPKQREHFNSLYTGTNMAIMELCQDGPYQDEFLKHAPCMQKSKAEYELVCYKSYQKTTQEIMTNGSLGQQNLKSLCCAFQEYLECSHHTVRRQCGDDTARFTKEFLDRMSSSLLKAHCAPYTECTVNSGISTLNLSAIMPMTLILLMRYFT
ncbi:hypothetical protein ALC57_03619 [Trachymyrmex cornetzi]|uniref:Uncharacterized protein n=1 Tax=Trachymyrmex cornetzi TaxID=471704 RepID=A0A195EG95_9HYME|nr:hypothetical protein ALC57_03619 [Trachymyrmex cornetzi]